MLWSLLFIFSLSFTNTWAARLRPGDVILQPLSCYICPLLETMERTPFAHMGVVVGVQDQVIWVAESFQKVRLVPLEEFFAKGKTGEPHLLLRLKEQRELDLFRDITPWLGAGYDRWFNWSNYDSEGQELFYCSELVTKLLNLSLEHKIPTKEMDFRYRWSFWENYFQGRVPQGEAGNSPGDFMRSELFVPLATYQDGLWNWH